MAIPSPQTVRAEVQLASTTKDRPSGKNMSSGWGYYDTELARTRARGQCAALRERLLDAIAAVRAREGETAASAGLLDRRPPADGTQADFDSWNAEAAAEAHRLERRAASHDEQQGSEGLAEQFRQLAASGRTARRRRVASKHEPRTKAAPPGAKEAQGPSGGGSAATGSQPGAAQDIPELSPAEKATRIAAALEAVDAEADDTERLELIDLANTILVADQAVFSTLLTDLKVRVQAVNRAAVDRREMAARADALLVSLAGLEGREVADARSLLERVKQGTSRLRLADVGQVQQVRERALAEQEREFVATQLAQALAGLGYTLGTEFEADLRAGRPGVALVDASPEHAVHVEVDDGALAYRLVRSEPGDDPARDRMLESELCKSMGRALGELHGVGVGFTFTEHHEPGTLAVEVSEHATEERRRRDRVARSEPKTRERDR